MQGVINTMLTMFEAVKESGSYLILMLAALYILYRVHAEKNQWYIYYALLCLILVCANPALVWILSKAFPVLGSYVTFLPFVPTLLFIPFAVAELTDKAKSARQAAGILVLTALLIGLAGNLFGLYQKGDNKAIQYGESQAAVVEVIKEQQPEMVLADETILPFLRTKAPETVLLYGRDLYQHGMDLGIIDLYGEELLDLYEAMKNPKDTIDDILSMADIYGCDMVIVKQFETAPAKSGHYTKLTDNGHYIVYMIQ